MGQVHIATKQDISKYPTGLTHTHIRQNTRPIEEGKVNLHRRRPKCTFASSMNFFFLDLPVCVGYFVWYGFKSVQSSILLMCTFLSKKNKLLHHLKIYHIIVLLATKANKLTKLDGETNNAHFSNFNNQNSLMNKL